jgi:hypothetical protein
MLVTVSATVSLKIAVIRTFADNNHRLGAALYNGFAAQAILRITHEKINLNRNNSDSGNVSCG